MLYRNLADLVFILHFAFVLFVVFGGLLVLWRRAFLWLHIPALLWATLVEFFQLFCPLTTLEKYFITLGGERGYDGGFIEYYVSLILYAHITPPIQMTLGVVLLAFNLLVYFYIFRRDKLKFN